MLGVPVPLVSVVDMVLMRDRNVPAALAVRVRVAFMGAVTGSDAFVGVVFVHPVQVTVVHEVDVIPVRYGDVPAARTVRVIVADVGLVVSCDRHRMSPPRSMARPDMLFGEPVVRLTVTAFAGKRLTRVAVAGARTR